MGYSLMKFDQYYLCNDKKFYNLFEAFDYYRENKQFIHYVIDKDFVKSLENFKRPKNLSTVYFKNLMVQTLKLLRKKHNKIRLAFSGGTDSWTILKLCVENDIFLDEVVCHLFSFSNNIRSNIEYLPGLKYAQQQVGKTVGKLIVAPMQKEFLLFLDDEEWYKKTFGPFMPMRTAILQKWLKSMDDDNFITISGLEKPMLFVENNKVFWTNLDEKCFGEFMNFKNHYPLYHSKENPELTVAMTFLFLESIPKSILKNNKSLIYEDIEDVEIKKKVLHTFGIDLGKPWLHTHKLKSKSHSDSIKTKYFFKELKQQGLEKYIDKNFKIMQNLYTKYKDIPYSVNINNGWVKSVGRFSQKIQIGSDSFGQSDR